MTKNLRNLLTCLIAAALLGGFGLCELSTSAHACCDTQTMAAAQKLMPCCMDERALDGQDHRLPQTPDTSWQPAPAATSLQLSYLQESRQTSLKKRAALKDDSGRYLELRVLLN